MTLAALVTGIASIVRIRQDPERYTGYGPATIGLGFALFHMVWFGIGAAVLVADMAFGILG